MRYYDVLPYLSYQYRLSPFEDIGDYMYGKANSNIYESYNRGYSWMVELLYLIELVEEVGDNFE